MFDFNKVLDQPVKLGDILGELDFENKVSSTGFILVGICDTDIEWLNLRDGISERTVDEFLRTPFVLCKDGNFSIKTNFDNGIPYYFLQYKDKQFFVREQNECVFGMFGNVFYDCGHDSIQFINLETGESQDDSIR